MTVTIIQAITFSINCFVVMFICIIFSRWIHRVEQKVDIIDTRIRASRAKINCIYLNQLSQLQHYLITNEQYEEAGKISKLIEIEINLQKDEQKGDNL